MSLACGIDGCGGQVASDGFCDTCGRQPGAPEPTSGAPSPTGAGPTCPRCGSSRDPGASFCEACGFDFLNASTPSTPVARPAPSTQEPPPEPMSPAGGGNPQGAHGGSRTASPDPVPAADWQATVTTDAVWYARFCETWRSAHGDDCPIRFPGDHERSVRISGPVVVIGRHAAGIDLADEPNDPAVSHRHASLVLQPEGTYAVTDLDSSNGTYVGSEPIAKGQTVPIAPGGSFNVGAFTRITLEPGVSAREA